MARTVMFTHTDLDGAVAAILFQYYSGGVLGESPDIRYCDYDNIDRELQVFFHTPDNALTNVLVVDIAPQDERTWLALLSHKAQVWVYDHHKTSADKFQRVVDRYAEATKVQLPSNITVQLDTSGTRCGSGLLFLAMLGWHWPEVDGMTEFNDRFARIVRLTALWDLHLDTDSPEFEDAKDLNRLLGILGRKRFMQGGYFGGGLWAITDANRALLELDKEKSHKYARASMGIMTVDQFTIAETVADEYISDVAEAILAQGPKGVIIYNPRRMTASVRSADEKLFNAREYCEHYLGGGHDKAAGFPLVGEGLERYFNYMRRRAANER